MAGHVIGRYAGVTRATLEQEPADLVVWPETAVPVPPRNEAFEPVRALVREIDVPLVFGGYDFQVQRTGRWRVYNTLFWIDARGTQVMVMGGLYHPSSQSFASDDGLSYLRRLGINKAFISAGGVHWTSGASCSNFHEVAVKQAVIETAMESILVIDASKLGSLKSAFFSDIGAFSRIIVGGAASSDMRKHFRSLPVQYVTSTT